MKTFLSNLWAALCGRVPETLPPVVMKSAGQWKLMTAAELEQMKRRWKTSLQGQARSPAVIAVCEMIEHRLWQADMLAQQRKNHAGEVGLVHYANGESAGLNDLLSEIVRTLHAPEEAPEQGME